MKQNYRLTVLTPCHIGSGVKLRKDIHYVIDGRNIGIIDPEKVFAIIGEQGIDDWCNTLESKGSFFDFIKGKKPDIELEEFCSAIIDIEGRPNGIVCTELKRHAATLDKPYIPGSSLKGAIVSALLGYSNALRGIEENAMDSWNRVSPRNNNIVNRYFSKSENNKVILRTSALRHLIVGDIHFESQTKTCAVLCKNINIRESVSELEDSRKSGYVEAIPEQTSSLFSLHINSEQLQRVNENNYLGYTNSAFDSEANLLKAINEHTLSMLNAELDKWHNYHSSKAQIELNDSALKIYLGHIEKMKEEAEQCCTNGGALLRVGYGNGWDSVIGGWIEGGWDVSSHTNEVWRKIMTTVRPISKRDKDNNINPYEGYVFPKTRRIIDGCKPMGFVKIEKIIQ